MVDSRQAGVIILVMVGLLGVALLIGGVGPFSSVSGTSLLSLDQVRLESTYAPLDGEQVWVYTLRQGGLGQRATGKVTPEDAAKEYSGDAMPEEDFSLTVDYEPQICSYDINIDANAGPIYDYTINGEFRTTGFTCNSNPPQCGAGAEPFYSFHDPPLSFLIFDPPDTCFTVCGTKKTGAVGSFDSPDVNQDYTVTVSAVGETYSADFSTLNGNVKGEVGPNTYVVWNGNLVTGSACTPNSEPYRPVYTQGSWRAASSVAYNNYRSAHATLLSTQPTKIEDANTQIGNLNLLSDSAISQKQFADSTNNIGSLSNAQMIVEQPDPVQLATLTAYIKADWIGIVTPVGEPEIKSVDSACFGASSDGVVEATIENVGDQLGSFGVFLECSGVFSEGQRLDITLQPGAEQTVFLPLSADASEETRDECVVVAEGTASTDKQSVDVCVIPNRVCQPGAEACLDGDVQRCNGQGSGWNIVETCDAGCELDSSGVPFCTENPPAPAQSGGSGDDFNTVLFIIASILGIAGAGTVGFYTQGLRGLGTPGTVFWVLLMAGTAVGLFLAVPAVWAGIVGLF